MDINLEKEVIDFLSWSPKPKEVLQFIARKILEARIEELEMNMTCDSERLNKIRIIELYAELNKLEGLPTPSKETGG